MSAYDLSELSDYERKAWYSVQQWRDAQAARQSRVPALVRNRAKRVGEIAKKGWDATPGSELFEGVLNGVLSSGEQAVADAVAASLQRDRILRAARSEGANVRELADLRTLDLRVIDAILPSLSLRYAAGSAATGAASGFVAGGGTAAMVGSVGVAAAPGALMVVGALAGDVVATIALAARVVSHYAGYYGYDARDENEKAVLLAVIGVGIAGEGAAKQAALLHVRQVAMMVARRATWKELSEEAVVKVIQALFAKISVLLTKEKLAQALPVVGVVAGAGMNYSLMRKVGTAASFMYRERFLIDKYGLDAGDPEPDLSGFIDVEGIETRLAGPTALESSETNWAPPQHDPGSSPDAH